MKTPGSYALTIRLKKGLTASIGRKEISLTPGWYVYTGSALSGLESRLSRHLRTNTFKHWHVDHLLANGNVVDIQTVGSALKTLECELGEQAGTWEGAFPVQGFGATDCGCKTHLHYFKQRPTGSTHSSLSYASLDPIFEVLHDNYVEHASYDRDPFETLVSCVLSLRTKDPVTRAASKRLFSQMRTPEDFIQATTEAIAELIFPVGMYKQKSVNLIKIAQHIIDDFGGETPSSIDDLVTLPGVGRKTANLVRSFSFHLPAVCVDVHVHRITNRWGLLRTATADETEFELRRLLPEKHWIPINPLLVQHGQQVCRPTRPKCGICQLQPFCNYPALLQEQKIRAAINGPMHPSLRVLPPAEGVATPKTASPFEE